MTAVSFENRAREGGMPRAALLCALLGAGCASSPPTHFHTLAPLPEARVRMTTLAAGPLAVGLGPVRFPGLLDRPQLVARAGDTRLAVDEFERWGGRLEDDFVRVWSENLAHLLDNSRMFVFPSELRAPLDYRVVAEVLRFETDAEAAWLKVREDTYRQALSEPGDAAARVAALSAALGAFSRAVAAVLRHEGQVHP